MKTIDLKKTLKPFYAASATKPALVDVPPLNCPDGRRHGRPERSGVPGSRRLPLQRRLHAQVHVQKGEGRRLPGDGARRIMVRRRLHGLPQQQARRLEMDRAHRPAGRRDEEGRRAGGRDGQEEGEIPPLPGNPLREIRRGPGGADHARRALLGRRADHRTASPVRRGAGLEAPRPAPRDLSRRPAALERRKSSGRSSASRWPARRNNPLISSSPSTRPRGPSS